ncbi:hypothetical protein D048_0912 [Vibrio parahaemolyticus VPTS-2009]|nr:hypothetical protein VPUCM_20399 [Vibrio parahaemolyticus UCM-V493]EXJ31103.1 hypothetical protein D048_0912 [Vibrio parahaemolyticus VPTS-2009]
MSEKINVKDKILCTCHSIFVLVCFLSYPSRTNGCAKTSLKAWTNNDL